MGSPNPTTARKPARTRSGSAPAEPGSVRADGRLRERRVYDDDRRLLKNRGDDTIPNKHPLVGREPAPKAKVRARLLGLAREAGLEILPGEGSLTLATRYLPGGRSDVVAYVRLAAANQDPDALLWLHVWESLKPWEQRQVTLDDICAAAGVSPGKMVKAIVGSAFDANCDVANLVAAMAHPRVVKASIRAATRADGIEDRKLLFQHHRFIPVNKGATVNINASATANAAAAAQANPELPSFADDLDVVDEQPAQSLKMLEAEFDEAGGASPDTGPGTDPGTGPEEDDD